MALRQQPRSGENLAALVEKRRHAKESSTDTRIFELRDKSQEFSRSMEDIVGAASKLNELMQGISSAAMETNKSVGTNMKALKEMDAGAASLIDAMVWQTIL